MQMGGGEVMLTGEGGSISRRTFLALKVQMRSQRHSMVKSAHGAGSVDDS